jgi:MEMO1 family protein
MPHPRFRDTFKIFTAQKDGQEVFVVVDEREHFLPGTVVLPPFYFVVASLLDGRRDSVAIQAEIREQLKAEVGVEEIDRVVKDMEENLLLESPRVLELRKAQLADYLAAPTRPLQFVPASGAEMNTLLAGYYDADGGAGKIGPRRNEPLSGILAPHIDFTRGGACYSHAYKEVAERSDADLYVLLGVPHLSPPNPFVFTSKDYGTPWGPVQTDREALAAVEKKLGKRIYDHEITHLKEHSLEFQAVWLKHTLQDRPFTVLPVLCSAFEQWCDDASPSTAPDIEAGLAAIREATAGRKVCIIGGVDFAHVGPSFGDQVEVDQKLITWMQAGDARSLDAIVEGSAEGFWNSVTSDGNRRHVCGLSATYAALRLLDGAAGTKHRYDHAPDPAGGIVSFASVSFKPKP